MYIHNVKRKARKQIRRYFLDAAAAFNIEVSFHSAGKISLTNNKGWLSSSAKKKKKPGAKAVWVTQSSLSDMMMGSLWCSAFAVLTKKERKKERKK